MSDDAKTPLASAPRSNGLIVVASEASVSRAISLALARLADDGPIIPGIGPLELIAPADRRRPLLKSAVDASQRVLQSLLIETNVKNVALAGLGTPQRGHQPWVAIPAPTGTERFSEILVPARRSPTATLGLVTVAPRDAMVSRLRPMSVLASLAHPRQQLAARLHNHRRALTAELASPWQVDLAVVVAARPSFRIAAVTHDLIAAELGWLALAASGETAEAVGPWEDPAVQRATQLGLGALGPHQISVVSTGTEAAVSLAGQIATTLGVPAGP